MMNNEIQQELLKQLRLHQTADAFIQGSYSNYSEKFKGCHIGCGIKSTCEVMGIEPPSNFNSPEFLEKHLSIPQSISRMCEFVFEGLPHEQAVEFSIKSYELSTRPNVDLNGVTNKQSIWLLDDDTYGAKLAAKGFHDSEKAINDVINLLKNGGTKIDFEMAARAAEAAWAARAAEAARAAAWAAAWAAWAARAARAALAAEAAGTAWEGAGAAFIVAYKNNLLMLLETALL